MAKEKSTEVMAAPAPGAVAVYDYGAHRGGGFEGTTKEDFAIPFLHLLQAQSPQVMRGKPECIPGASAGQLFNSVTGEVFDGEKGIIIVPCCREYITGEWRPDRGGLVARHDPHSPLVVEARRTAKEFGKLKSPTGNDLQDAFLLYCLTLPSAESQEADDLPIVISFSSTKIKKYKQAMSKWRSIKGEPPLFAFRVLLRTVPDSNTKGDFFNFDLSPAVGSNYNESLLPPNHPVFLRGAQLAEQVNSGSVKADYNSQQQPVTEETHF